MDHSPYTDVMHAHTCPHMSTHAHTHVHTLLIRKLTKSTITHRHLFTHQHMTHHAVMNTEAPVSFQTPLHLVVVYPTHEYHYSMPSPKWQVKITRPTNTRLTCRATCRWLHPLQGTLTNSSLLRFRMSAKLQDLCKCRSYLGQ